MTPDSGLSIGELLRIIPHRYPMLMIDRVVTCQPGRYVRARKNVSAGEPYFQGHFPGHPIMPGVLIVEAMAQAGAVLVLTKLAENARSADDGAAAGTNLDEVWRSPSWSGERPMVYLRAIERARFRRPVSPGDVLDLEVTLVSQRSELWKVSAKAHVDEALVASAELGAVVVWTPLPRCQDP
ncbi:MAG: 3-hydroxyacyl-ACP dehydratase FabZ [Candidatus Schekmanbacteria bacterium]|nr:3-hydroxyacyl-ACP dehydratase FabZ [Candidatus Schekmanbacteria bacterium]